MKSKEYEQLYDGVGVALRSRQVFRFACCDCGLVHNMVIAPCKGGWVGFAVERNKRATTARRKYLNKKGMRLTLPKGDKK